MKTFKSMYGNVKISIKDEKIIIKSKKLSRAEAEIVASEYLDSINEKHDVRNCYESKEGIFEMRFDI